MENRNGKEKEVKGRKGEDGREEKRKGKGKKRTGAREEFCAVVIFS